ncbi:MAG: ATP-binding protein [Candidatus Omnitrophota bacterium]
MNISRGIKIGTKKLLAKGIQLARKSRLIKRAEKSKMESMVRSMAEGVVMIDEAGEIEVLNPQAKRMLDLSGNITAEALNKRIEAIGLSEVLGKVQAKKRLMIKEVVISQRKKDMILRCSAAPVKDELGQNIGTVTILRDITKEKEIERMKTDFVATVSHELRTPLSITKEGVELVLDGIPGAINEKQRKVLNSASENIDRLARIINSLLDISKIEEGRLEYKREMVDIISLIKRVFLSFEPKAQKKGLKLITDFSKKTVDIYADEDRIIQVFTNLIGNAIKFTEKGWIKISLKELEDEVECMVVDTGIGFSEKDLPNVFRKFQQFARIPGAGEKGTGLGLSIARGIVEMHNGRIWVMSRMGIGTKFVFTLPKYTDKGVFNSRIDKEVRESLRKGLKTSVITVAIVNLDRLRKKFPKDQTQAISKDMEDILNNSLRREGDVAFEHAGKIVVLLTDCPKKNALKIKSRIEQALKKHLVWKRLTKKVKLGFDCLTCPDDVKNSEELIKKIKGQPREDQSAGRKSKSRVTEVIKKWLNKRFW